MDTFGGDEKQVILGFPPPAKYFRNEKGQEL